MINQEQEHNNDKEQEHDKDKDKEQVKVESKELDQKALLEAQNKQLEQSVLNEILKILPAEMKIRQTEYFKYEMQSYSESLKLEATSRLEVDQYPFLLKAKELIQEKISAKNEQLVMEFLKLLSTLKFQYKFNDYLQPIPGLELIDCADYTAKQAVYTPKPETVTILQFWTGWCGYSVARMQQIKANLETCGLKNQVQYVAISMDDELEDVTERIISEGYNQDIRHYRFEQGWNKDEHVLSALDFSTMPFVVMINNLGQIVSKGNLTDQGVEKITRLILENKNNELKELWDESSLQESDNSISQVMLEENQFMLLKEYLEKTVTPRLQTYNFGDSSFQLTLTRANELVYMQDSAEIESTTIMRTAIVMSYNIHNQLKGKIKEISEQIKAEMKEPLFFINGKCVVQDPQVELRLKIQGILKDHDITMIPQAVTYKTYAYDNETDKFDFRQQKKDQIDVKYEKKTKKFDTYVNYFKANVTVENLLNDMEYDLKQFGLRLMRIVKRSFQITNGDKFEPLIEHYVHKDNSKAFGLVYSKEYVLIIVYVNLENEDCISYLGYLYKCYKDDNWSLNTRQVKIMALSLEVIEDKKAAVAKFPKEYKQIIQFCFPKAPNQKDIQLYKTDSEIPFVIIVDKQGKLKETGIDFDVLKAVQGAQIVFKAQKQTEDSIPKSQFEGIIKYFQSTKWNGVLNKLGLHNVFKLEVRLAEAKQQDGTKIYKKPRLTYVVRENKMPIFNNVLEKLYAICPERNLVIDKTISKTFNVAFPGTVCAICQTELAQETPQYYSPFKSEHICVACAEYEDITKTGPEKYKYTDTIIFINPPLQDQSVLVELDLHNLGNNLQIQSGQTASQMHDMTCNGCDSNKEGPRYIAINCRVGLDWDEDFVDFCCDCFSILKDKQSEAAQEIVKKNVDDEMTSDCLFLRVLFNNGYLTF